MIKVNYPDSVLEDLQLEGVLMSNINTDQGITLLSDQEGNEHLLHVFTIERADGEAEYEITGELQTFTFSTRKHLSDFIQKLPSMSVVDYMHVLQSEKEKCFTDDNILIM